MTGLLISELRRAGSRRLLWFLALIVFFAVVVAAVILAIRSNPPSPSALAAARTTFEKKIARCDHGKVYQPADVPPDETIEQFCRDHIVLESFLDDPRFHLTVLTNTLKGTSVALAIIGFLLGASFIGAEWQTGTVATLLTWEPRRIRVQVAKAVATAIVLFLLALLLQAVLAAAFALVASVAGTSAGADGAWFREVEGIAVRAAIVASIAGVMGFAIASVGRSTSWALGLGLVYMAGAEGVLRGLRPAAQRWLLGNNAARFILGGNGSVASVARSASAAGLLLAALALGMVAVATVVFRVRDVD